MSTNRGTGALVLALASASVVGSAASCGSDPPSVFPAEAGTPVTPAPSGTTPGPHGDSGPSIDPSHPSGPSNDFVQPVLDTGVGATVPALFAKADADATGPCVFEPEVGTLFPNNWLRPRFRFNAAHQENLFEITLVVPNETTPLRIYTKQSGYKLDAALWAKITSVGVGTVHLTVRSAAVDAGGALTGGPWKGTEGDFEVAPVAAKGAIVYWTTSDGTVLKGFTVGDETVQSVITPPQVDANSKCVACHTSTPDGLYAGLTVSDSAGDGQPGRIALRSVDGKQTKPPFLSASAETLLARVPQHVPAFSKAHWADGDHTMLTNFVKDGKTEIIWTDLEATSTDENVGWGVIHRDGDAKQASGSNFSHDGTKIVYTSIEPVGSGITSDSTNGRLWVVPYGNRAGGAATQIAGPTEDGVNYAYAAFSADDQILAFNRIVGGKSYNNAQSEVYIAPAAGGALTKLAANDPPACLGVTSPGLTNSWPKWSPEVKAAGGKSYYFLIFSSTRDPDAHGAPQLFVAPMTIENGVVKTYAALSLWNQPVTESNHTPAWDVFQLPPPGVH